MPRLGLLIISLVLLAPLASAQDTVVRTLWSSGLQRSYRLHVPASYSPSPPAPLVLCFHAYTSSAQTMEDISALSQLSESAGFIVAYPQALTHAEANDTPTWLGDDGSVLDRNDVFIGDLLATLRGGFAIDGRRIFVTGYSQGGGMCYIAASAYPETIAAMAPVAVSLPRALPFDALAPSRPMPALMINGTADWIVPYDGGPGLKGIDFTPVPELAWRVAAHDGCFLIPLGWGLPNWNWFDGCTASVTFYGWGAQGSEVELITVTGGGHTWPGTKVWLPQIVFGNTCQDFDASATIWDFFSRHPLPAGVAN